jgi:hypothetical protein
MIALLLLQVAAQAAQPEANYYAVDYLVQPDGQRIEVGGLDFLPDGRLVCSTRRGQVWIVDNPLANDPKDAQFHLFCEGLHEGLGLEVVNGKIFVLQRGELSRLVDEDNDGTCDYIDTIAQGWGYSGHYHEFAYGLPRDDEGNFYASFNVSFGDPQWWHGRSTVPDRGWILRIHPDGQLERVACGARSPCGLGRNSAGDIFYTDNQGDWMPACPIFQVKDGEFFGHPASLNWTPAYLETKRTASDTIPPERARVNAAIWLPYDWSRSTGNLVEDTTAGKFGPFAGQMFVAEMTNGYVLRAGLEKVRGEYQGWCIPFRHAVGSNVRLRFAPDGTLFCGFTDRGWGGQPPGDGIGRVRWTKTLPFEIADVHLVAGGFDVSFTKPLAPDSVAALQHTEFKQYDYNYWWEYGAPPAHVTQRAVVSATLDASQKIVHFVLADLAPGMVARVKFAGLAAQSGDALLHDEFAYTVNQLIDGPPSTALVAKLVPPPAAKERGDEGVIFLMRGERLDAFTGAGWQATEIKLDAADPTKLAVDAEAKPDEWSGSAVTNAPAGHAEDLVTKFEFGDIDFSLDFMLPKGGNSGVYVMSRYEIQLFDSSGKTELSPADCGGIYAAHDQKVWPGRAPTFNAFRGPGKWHSLSCMFQAPRFDATGKKIANAKFKRVMIDDTLLQEEIEVPCPTGAAGDKPEVRYGPLRLQGDHSAVAFRGLRVKSREVADNADGWTRIFDGKTLDGWKISDNGQWKVENGEIVGTGPVSHLFSPRGDYKNLEFRAKVKINEGGNSGMYFRAEYGAGWPVGYEAQVNSTHTDPVRTGSLYNLAPLKTQLIPADAWFVQQVTCRDEPAGVHITIRVNGIVVNDFIDKDRKHASGHVAFQQHNEGSVVHFKDVEVRELP